MLHLFKRIAQYESKRSQCILDHNPWREVDISRASAEIVTNCKWNLLIMSDTRERALSLLGRGYSQSVVASALGVTDSQISQLMADKEFAEQVSRLRFESLTEANTRDSKYDALEDKLLDRLEDVADYITKPREILSALNILNKAERRGQPAVEQTQLVQNVVQLTVPIVLQQKFMVSESNEVIDVEGQQLTTMSSKDFKSLVDRHKPAGKGVSNEITVENGAAVRTGS